MFSVVFSYTNTTNYKTKLIQWLKASVMFNLLLSILNLTNILYREEGNVYNWQDWITSLWENAPGPKPLRCPESPRLLVCMLFANLINGKCVCVGLYF